MNGVSRLLKRVADRLYKSAAATSILELNKEIASKNQIAELEPLLVATIQQAWTQGRTIDLTAIGYGPDPWHKGKHFCDTPSSYYFFLAGLVRSQHCKRIVEIGTHYGGSTNSMLCGIADQKEAQIVTVDITDINPLLHQRAGITKLTADANSEAVIKLMILMMGDAPIDLLYVDADHNFLPTITNLALYIFLLRPRFVVIDDILLNEEMRSFWNAICATQGTMAINCVDVIPEIREKNVGFGLLRLG
jgi:hypothetical protein